MTGRRRERIGAETMDLGLRGKRVLITGAAGGIGRGIGEAFAQEGADLLLNYRSNRDACQQFAEELRQQYGVKTVCIPGDIGKEEEVVRLYDEAEAAMGGVDILINNAGKVYSTPLLEVTMEEWEDCLSSNLTGQFLMSREYARRAIPNGIRGSIVNIISKAAVFSVTPGKVSYVSNKAGEIGLTHMLAVELIEHGIRVNGILPGHVIGRRLKEEQRLHPERFQARIAKSPLKRCGEPWEIGAMIAFLTSDQCGLAVGTIVDATGGLLLGY